MFIKTFLIAFYTVWLAEVLVIIFEFNENMGVVTRNHTPFHDVALEPPMLNVLEITSGYITNFSYQLLKVPLVSTLEFGVSLKTT